MSGEPVRPRVVLDTNVVLSGIFFAGLPARILEASQTGQLTLALSPAILAEYQRAGAALAARYPDATAPLETILAVLARSATIVDAPSLGERTAPDPDDDKFLACALAAEAAIIITGDKPLLSVFGLGRSRDPHAPAIRRSVSRRLKTRIIGQPKNYDHMHNGRSG